MIQPKELVVRTVAALRAPSEDLPSLLERLGTALEASAVVSIRPQGSGVIVDYAWRVHDWWSGTKSADGLHPDDLLRMAPAELAQMGGTAAGIPPQAWWDAGRATTAAVVMALAGTSMRIPERGVTLLATAVDVIVARENASVSARVNALLRERARMGSVLHEGVVQDLATLTLQLEMLGELIPRDPSRAKQLAAEARVAAANALDHARSAILDLTPVVSDDSWLIHGLKTFVDDFARQWSLVVSFVHKGMPRIVGPDYLGVVFAFVQEALTNLRKHSTDRRGDVRVQFEEGALRVCVRNENGAKPVGGAPARSWPSGQGIKLMRCRARLLGGDVHLSRPSRDQTAVTLELPLQ